MGMQGLGDAIREMKTKKAPDAIKKQIESIKLTDAEKSALAPVFDQITTIATNEFITGQVGAQNSYAGLIDKFRNNPKEFANNLISNAAGIYGGQSAQADGNLQSSIASKLQSTLNGALKFAVANGISQDSAISQANNAFSNVYSQNVRAPDASFGDFLKQAALMVAPFVIPGVGATLGTALGASASVAPILGSAIIGGTMAEAQGGDFLKGALTSGAGSAIGGIVAPELAAATGSNIAAGALTGGALAELQGGDFLQGAIQGGLSAGMGDYKNALQQEQFDTAMTESGLAGQTTTSPSDFYQTPTNESLSIGEIISGIQPFVPDYSLSSPEVVPGLKPEFVEIVQTPTVSENPTIAEIINSLQPIEADYSLGSTANADSVNGSGITAPNVPNLESMGGGQGLVMPVDGGYITQEGFVPDSYEPSIGDPNSFINQPAPQINYTLPEFTDLPPVDNSAELAAADLAKLLAPIVVQQAFQENKTTEQPEEVTGFGIVPIPSEWQSASYNKDFTPSAQVDFGASDLLRGTQWANPQARPTQMSYDLSDIINTLNYESVPFLQQQAQPMQQSFAIADILQQLQPESKVGFNDQIGGLNGKQVSISDIIAGIQSQYG